MVIESDHEVIPLAIE